MGISVKQMNQENEYLNKTIKVIEELLEKNGYNINSEISRINEMKRYVWENNTFFDDTELADNLYSVDINVNTISTEIKKIYKLQKALNSPYFGRIDFSNNNSLESVYIGIYGITKDLNYYVYDWRAPIASLFYNYSIGKASYESPIGTINGNITLKRQYKIINKKLERCFDSTINIDDKYLQEILSTSSSDKMTNIVNTIQKEQNEIIRNISDKYLLVQGIAGSGKTSVAMHRIAYLLYQEKNLKSNNILIFSPNDIFSQYISNVLPELGEDNTLNTTYSDFSGAYIKEFDYIESFTEFIERYYKNNYIDNEKYSITKYKLSDDFKELLDKYIMDFKENILFTKSIGIRDKIITSKELNKLLKISYIKLPIFERIEKISEYICNTAKISYRKHGKKVQDKIISILNSSLDCSSLYNKIISSDEFKNKLNLGSNIEFNITTKLYYEDLIPLMYIYFEINGYPRNNFIKHIVIDEAQDYTMLQFYILNKIFKNASFTILGDINQTINPYYIYSSLNNINKIFDEKGKYIELNKTYRSSEEIINFTNKILGLNNTCSVRKSNSIKVIERNIDEGEIVNEFINDINKMRKNNHNKIAIITKNKSETLKLYDLLKDRIDNISIINQTGKETIDNVVILPSYISKGLEFDGVIAYSDEKNKYQEKDKYLFYVVCTRAQHELIIYNQI